MVELEAAAVAEAVDRVLDAVSGVVVAARGDNTGGEGVWGSLRCWLPNDGPLGAAAFRGEESNGGRDNVGRNGHHRHDACSFHDLDAEEDG